MPTLIKNGKNYSGTSVSLTQAEYDALSTTQKNDGTVYFISDSDAILDASDVSVGNGTVEDSIGSIAVIETSPATSSHAVGTYLVWNGKLYKVTSAISVSEQLVVGTNISATTVGDELKTETYIENGITFKRVGNQVFVQINAPTLASDGMTLISNLPSRYRPSSQTFFLSKCWNGTAYVDASFRIIPSGNVTMTALNNSAISGLQPNYFQDRGSLSYYLW